jgi:hypothetical protein
MLVVRIDYLSFAATGRSMILGTSNSANKITKLTRTTSGPAMQFNVKNGRGAPIKVNSKGRVGKLNADLLDGKHARDLGVRTRVYDYNVNLTSTSTLEFRLPQVPKGSHLGTMDAWIYGPGDTTMICYLRIPGASDRLQQWFPSGKGDKYFALSTSGVVTVGSTSDLTVRCSAGASGSWSDYNNFQVSLTPIDVRSNPTTGTLPRTSARQAPNATR